MASGVGITFHTQMISHIAKAAYTNQPGNFEPQQALAQVQAEYGVTAPPQQAYAEGVTAVPNGPTPIPIASAAVVVILGILMTGVSLGFIQPGRLIG